MEILMQRVFEERVDIVGRSQNPLGKMLKKMVVCRNRHPKKHPVQTL